MGFTYYPNLKMAVPIDTVLTLLFVVCLVSRGQAQWSSNPQINTPVCTAVGPQWDVRTIPDGAGGAICAWIDNRTTGSDIYSQRINSAGVCLWQANGQPICTATGAQTFPLLAPDGSGGAIIVWSDRRQSQYSIYAQRVDASGVPLWANDGIEIYPPGLGAIPEDIISDGQGGAYFTWNVITYINLPELYWYTALYGQHLNGSGVPLWQAGGSPICTAALLQEDSQLLLDDQGGVFVAWQDSRSGLPKISAQRMASDGSAMWAQDGIPICTTSGLKDWPHLTTDGSGGFIVTWKNDSNAAIAPSPLNLQRLFAQRVSPAGVLLWPAAGVRICEAESQQWYMEIVSDGLGGAIVAWQDERTTDNQDIYAQRIDSNASLLWTTSGIALCTMPDNQREPHILPDGVGGAIVVWNDWNPAARDVYAQRIGADGVPAWTPNGAAISSAPGRQFLLNAAGDGAGGAIFAWTDERAGSANADIYAAAITGGGVLQSSVAGIDQWSCY